MATYKIHEPPNVTDPEALDCLMAVERMRQVSFSLTQSVLEQLRRHPVTAATRVALAAGWRMNEGAISAQYLSLKNHVRDASILVLSLYELQLDLQYIAADLTRADTWIDHAKDNRKPWSVATQLREICLAARELEAQLWLYRHLSMSKHANPVGGIASFPFAVSRNFIQYEEAEGASALLLPTLFALASCIERAAVAASRIWSTQGIEVADVAQTLTEQLNTVSKINERKILAYLQAARADSDAPPGAPAG